MTVQNFQVTDNVGGAESTGQGHLVFYMDIFPPTQKGQSALPRIGNAVSVTDTTHTWSNVSAGPHLFSVQLVNNNDTPLDPPVVAAVIFEVPSSVSQTNQQVAAALSSNPAITSITVEVLPGTSTPTMTNTAIR